MKKLLSFMLVITMLLTIAACGTPQSISEAPVITPTTQSEPIPQPTPVITPVITPDPTPEPIRILTLDDFDLTDTETLILTDKITVFETNYFILTIPEGVYYTSNTVETFNKYLDIELEKNQKNV